MRALLLCTALVLIASGCNCANSINVCGDAGCAGGNGNTGGGTGTGGSGGEGGGGEACVTQCGSGCCGASDRCEANECRKACAMDTTRCGSVGAESCCTASEVCYFKACVTPGAACSLSMPCGMGEYCEASIGKCLPLRPGSTTCEFRPDAGSFAPTTLWNYNVSTDDYTQVMMTPVVVDVNADQIPDVLASFFTIASGYGGPGVMRALSGDDGRVLWTTADAVADHVHPPASIAAADLDGTGVVAITVAKDGTLIAFDAKTGTQKWKSKTSAGAASTCAANWGGPSIANVTGDANAEIICGLGVWNKDGVELWKKSLGGGAIGPLTTAVDLDGDGKLDITDGEVAYDGQGNPLPGFTGVGAGGLIAIGDLVDAAGSPGRDGKPEIVSVSAGAVTLVNGQTGAVLIAAQRLPSDNGGTCSVGAASPGNGGPPTVADFDGDGQAEVGVAALGCYTMFKVTKPAGGALAFSVSWSNRVQDLSSSVTGSSVFDFDGDGQAEVVYADEVLLHVYDGKSGREIFSRPHCSGTTYENPVIVDVNANGRADIVVAENTYGAGSLGCDAAVKPGIAVFKDARDAWVNTRAIWNQHTYHVTNVCDGRDLVCGGPGAAGNGYARVPASEPANVSFTNSTAANAKPLNNFRQNVQGEGLFNAPDLEISDLGADLTACPASVTFRARVTNQGSLGVNAGVKVAFYRDGMPPVLLGVTQTVSRLLPGQSEVVTLSYPVPMPAEWPLALVAVVDDDGTGVEAVSECVETNNRVGPLNVVCVGVN